MKISSELLQSNNHNTNPIYMDMMKYISRRRWFTLILLTTIFYGCNEDIKDFLGIKDPPVIIRIRTSNEVYRIFPGDTTTFIVDAENTEEGELSYKWSANGGGLLLPVDLDSVQWVAPLTGGFFMIEVTVSNIDNKSVSDSIAIEVISLLEPIVQIITPFDGADLIQFSTIDILANASHQSGLQTVSLFINDSLITDNMVFVGGAQYIERNFLLDLPGGPTTIRVVAVANTTNITGSDDIVVNIEEILP